MASESGMEYEGAEGFQRSRSRVYFQSDFSSPTSWEFRGQEATHRAQLSLLENLSIEAQRASTLHFSPRGDTLRIDGSRNSTGSSTGSHKSQDSGFSDSGEKKNQRSPPVSLSFHHQSGNSRVLFPTILEQSGPVLNEIYQAPYEIRRDYGTPMSLRMAFNSSGAQDYDGSFNEIILANSNRFTPMPNADQSYGDLGVPACCSTPVMSTQTPVAKINNFESLNKNVKAFDSNNNSSSHGSEKQKKSLWGSWGNSQSKIEPSNSPSVESKRTNGLNETVNEYKSSRAKLVNKSSPKWQTLPKGFKRVPDPDNSTAHMVVKSHFDNDATRLWLHELKTQTEDECLTVLQVKNVNLQQPRAAQSLFASPMLSIRNAERMANLISDQFGKICKLLEQNSFPEIPSLVFNLIDHLNGFIWEEAGTYGILKKVESRLVAATQKLRITAERLELALQDWDGVDRVFCRSIIGNLVESIVSLGNTFGQVVDVRVKRDLSSVLSTIEKGGIHGILALKFFASILVEGGSHFCQLAAEIRTVRVILGSIIDSKDLQSKMWALRCLATLLCVGGAVKDFDKAGGFEIIADILYDPQNEMPIKLEAVAVLTQATDPWIDLETNLENLSIHLEKTMISLTNMIPLCCSEEDSFLLTVAAISNISFLEIASLTFLCHFGAIHLIIRAVERKKDFSIFVLDHVATILANMSGVEEFRQEIVSSGAVNVLLWFIQKKPSLSDAHTEIAACERLQQKSVIAISRLCGEKGVAQYIAEKGGLQRLVELSKNDKERNYSDGVLIACLASLRKIVGICGDEIIKGLKADDLVIPRLLDSFLLFSSRQESYV